MHRRSWNELAVANWEEKPKKDRGPKPRSLSKFKEHKFTAPPKPKEISHPACIQEPKKPVKSAYPEKPKQRPKTWRRLPVQSTESPPDENEPQVGGLNVGLEAEEGGPTAAQFRSRQPAKHNSDASTLVYTTSGRQIDQSALERFGNGGRF